MFRKNISLYKKFTLFSKGKDFSFIAPHYSGYNCLKTIIEKDKASESYIIFHPNNLVGRIRQWNLLLPNITPFYAIKCNPDPHLLNIMKLYNIYYDCASKNEIQNILHNGIDNKKILFANPSKIDTHILFAKEQNIPLMTFDSLEELNKIKLIFPDAKLIIRLKVDESYSDLKFNSKFGVDMVEAEYLLNRAKTLDLNVVGVSFHVGSKCNNSEVYRQSIYSCRILYDIAKTIGYKLSILDIGGGFPGYDDYIFRKMAMEIHCGLHEYFNKTSVSFIAEPGRYFATSAYTLVCKIINKKIIKEDNNKKIIYYINESIYGSFNNILTDRADIMINTLKPDNMKFISTIFGPTCDSLDCIALNVKLPELEVNDYIYFDNMGAYTVSSATNFNGFSHAKVKYILY